MTLPDGHMVVADVPLLVYTEGRGLGVEVEEDVENHRAVLRIRKADGWAGYPRLGNFA